MATLAGSGRKKGRWYLHSTINSLSRRYFRNLFARHFPTLERVSAEMNNLDKLDQKNQNILDEKLIEVVHHARDELRLDKAEFLDQAEAWFESVRENERDFVVDDNLDLLAQKLVRAADFARRTMDIDRSLFMEEAGAAFAYSEKHPLS